MNANKLLAAAVIAVVATTASAAEVPDEETKTRALKLGYMLNGDSMVRHPSLGSIDVMDLLELTKPRLGIAPKDPESPFGPTPKVKQ